MIKLLFPQSHSHLHQAPGLFVLTYSLTISLPNLCSDKSLYCFLAASDISLETKHPHEGVPLFSVFEALYTIFLSLH